MEIPHPRHPRSISTGRNLGNHSTELPKDEETTLQRGQVTCPPVRGHLMVKWDRNQVSWALSH